MQPPFSEKKGGTVVPPSNFQFVTTKYPLFIMVSDKFPSRTPAPTHTQAQDFNPYDAEKRLEFAVKLIEKADKNNQYTIAYSGGKDSQLLATLCKWAGVDWPLVYASTTIDPPGTLKFVEANGATILRPKMSFLQLIEKKGLPSMFRRYCCEYLKEQYIADHVVLGVRRSESVKRAKRYCSFENVRVLSKDKVVVQLFPIIHLSNEDVEYAINKYNIQCHPLYYDEEGRFHVEKRLGCLGCPLQSDRGRYDFLLYPKLLRQIAIRLLRYDAKFGRNPNDSYLKLAYHLFYSNNATEKYKQHFEGLFPANPKSVIEDYFKISLP